ncbi:MAG: PfkB family carbohydrate kinase [Mesorhizobium sp.]
MNRPRLLHAGSMVIDHIYRIRALPLPGTEVTAESYRISPGGGFNLAVAARRTGLPVAFVGVHGTGPNGDLLRAALAAEQIDILTAPVERLDSGVSTVLVTRDAERSFVSWPGAESLPDTSNIDAGPADWIFASGYTLSYPGSGESVVARIERLAHKNPLVFDPAPVVRDIPSAILKRVLNTCSWLSCNTDEAAYITDGAPHPAKTLLDLHCPRAAGVVVRSGRHGCLVRMRDGSEQNVPAFNVEAVDTNGAGDAHIGTFISSLAQGGHPFEAARFANAAAAIAVTRHGGPTAPTTDEIRQFLLNAKITKKTSKPEQSMEDMK